MKKLLKLAISLFIGITALAFASCNGNGLSLPEHTHTYGSETITKYATCTEKGEKTFLCPCGDTKIIYTAELGHDLKDYDAKAPTCENFGWNTYKECQRGECDYSTYKELKAKGHSYVIGVCSVAGCGKIEPAEEHAHVWDKGVITTPSTCAERGVKTFTCWCTATRTESVEKLKHDLKTYIGQASTCSTKGWNDYKVCERDGCEYTTYQELDLNPNYHEFKFGVCAPCSVKQPTSDGLQFTLSSDKTYYSLTGIGTCVDSVVVVPDTHEGLPVKQIDDYAFVEYIEEEGIIIGGDVKGVVIPNSVTTVEYEAFDYCLHLKTIEIGSGVTSFSLNLWEKISLTNIFVHENNTKYKDIDGNLYSKDGEELLVYPSGKSETSFSIPDGVTTIDGDAFGYDCILKELFIPASVTNLYSWSLSECFTLSKITIDENNTKYKDIDGVLYSKNGKTLLVYPSGKTETSFSIPDGVTMIDSNAFRNNCILKELFIPASVTNLYSWSLSEGLNLSKITVDENNTKYKDIDGVLYSKDGTTLFAYPSGKTETSFSIPEGVTTIDRYAFGYSYKLNELFIPASVTNLYSWSLSECYTLSKITVDENNTTYKDIDGVLYSKDGTTLVVYPSGKSTTFTIPEGVTTINSSAFASSLASLVIPESVTYIGSFDDCWNLSSITFKNPNGWRADGTAISADDLKDPATAAKIFTKYRYSTWTRK